MSTKTRLAKLEAASVGVVLRIQLESTPETRAQAAAELDVWRRSMVAEGWFATEYGRDGQVLKDTETQLVEAHEHDLHWVETGHHRRPV